MNTYIPYKILIPIDEDNIVSVEFNLSDGGKHVERMQIDEDEKRTLDQYLRDYLVAFEKGRIVELQNKIASAKYNQNELGQKLAVLNKIWGDFSKKANLGHVSSFLALIRMQDCFPELVLWQKEHVYFLNKLLERLEKISGFDTLKKHLGSDGAYDDQLFATYFYDNVFGVAAIEKLAKSKDEFDTDFSLQHDGSKWFIQVKSLLPNVNKRSLEQSKVYADMQIALKKKEMKRVSMTLDGLPPKHLLRNFDWSAFLEKTDLSKPVYIADPDNTRTGLNILFKQRSNKGHISGVDTIHFWSLRVQEVAARVREREEGNKFACLLVVPYGTVAKLRDKADLLYLEWRNLNIDQVIFFEYIHSVNGYTFSALEQSRGLLDEHKTIYREQEISY